MQKSKMIKTSMILSILTLSAAIAQTNGEWAVDADGNWGTDTNWTGNTIADGADATADFSQVDITDNRTVTLDTDRTIGHLDFQDASGGSSWALQNNILTLDTTTGTPSITAWNSTTIFSDLAGTLGFVKEGSSSLNLRGNNSGLSGTIVVNDGFIDLTSSSQLGSGGFDLASGGKRLELNAGNYNIAGPVSGGGTIRVQNSTGTVSFQQAGPGFTGKVQVQDGTLELSDAANSGLGAAEIEAGFNMRIRSSDDTARTVTNQLDFNNTNGNIRLGDGAGNAGDLNFTYTGNMNGVGNSGALRVEDGVTATIHANINSRSIRKFSEGTLILEGDSTTSEDTLVGNGGGSLIVNGSLDNSDVTVKRSLLGGDGSVKSFLVEDEGTIAPGNSVGILTVLNDATFNGGATYQVELDGITSDRLLIGGAMTLDPGALLDITGLADGTTNYIIAEYGSLSGTFDNPTLPSNYDIDYAYDDGIDTNNIALVVIPEPGTLALLGISLTALVLTRSRRRRG